MRYRTLGRTGLRVSEVGFGGAPAGIPHYLEPWDPAAAYEKTSLTRALHRALDLGLNYLDTAPGYGNVAGEAAFGEVIPHRRADCIVATKTSARHPAAIRASLEASLRRLQTEVIDVLQFHGGWYPPEEVHRILHEGGLETLQELRSEGKIRFLGFTAEGPSPGVYELVETGAFDVLQIRYNLLNQHPADFINHEGIIRKARERGMGIVTMRTLTSGIFQRLMQSRFPETAGLNWDAFLLNFVLSNSLIDVALIGMRRPEEVEQNAAVSDDESRRIDLETLHVRHFPPNSAI
jgi:aryl-alcohol dehydrogenase-like predicted oxidoreductase